MSLAAADKLSELEQYLQPCVITSLTSMLYSFDLLSLIAGVGAFERSCKGTNVWRARFRASPKDPANFWLGERDNCSQSACAHRKNPCGMEKFKELEAPLDVCHPELRGL
jgi:hypothetical protein